MKITQRILNLHEDDSEDETPMVMKKLQDRVEAMSAQKQAMFWKYLSEEMIQLFLDEAPSADSKYNRFLKSFRKTIFKRMGDKE